MPEEYASHWYLLANEARVYHRPVAVSSGKSKK